MTRKATALVTLLALMVLGAIGAGPAFTKGHKRHKKVKIKTETVTLMVTGGKMATELGRLGPDGRGHDTVIPASFNVKAGDKVTVTVMNFDEGPHSMTAPQLGLNAQIAAATDANHHIPSLTTFTFTVKKAGKYRWYCAVPCDDKQGSWAMSSSLDGSGPDQVGYMAGFITAS